MCICYIRLISQLTFDSYFIKRGSGPNPNRILEEGQKYLDDHFPNLDYIKSCSVSKRDEVININRPEQSDDDDYDEDEDEYEDEDADDDEQENDEDDEYYEGEL